MLAVMFTDVCDSASVYRTLGDAEAHKLGSNCVRMIVEAARRNGGRFIKTIGDGVMLTFANPRDAYRAAIGIQLAARESPLSVKVGMHYGPMIDTGNDVFGDTVNVAARVLARSAANEILMTRECVDALRPEQRATVRLLDTTSVKGRPEWLEIFRAIGDSEDATKVVSSSNVSSAAPTVLLLKYKDEVVRFELAAGALLIGRDPGCTLVVDTAWASRRHATLDVQRGMFVLVDHSANGTYVVDEDAAERHVNREVHHLARRGTISIGISAQENPEDVIRYRSEAGGA
jgi:pSer/pThr/pTyr-binding forkhead associated (FHA) protein